MLFLLFKGPSPPDMIQYGEDMDFDSSLMELPKSSSALPSEFQKPIRRHSSMPSNNKIQQDEDERDPRFMQLLKENLFCFWKRQKEEILRADPKKKPELPISRIRRAMKSNDQVKMVSAHSTVLFSKAIEMFILELTLRAWMQADQVKCRTLKRSDFARAIRDEEIFDFLSDVVPLQTYKVHKEANDGQGKDSNPAYQVLQPNNIPCQYQVQEANDGQGNESHPAYQVLQPNNIPYQFQVEEDANGGQGNEFHPAYQTFQPNNIPVEEANHVQGNKCHLANRMVQPHNIPQQYEFQVEGTTDDCQGDKFHPAYQMVQLDNISCQFQVQKEANDGQGSEFQARELKILSEALTKGFDLPAYQVVQPNYIPCQFQVEDEANDGQGNEVHPAYQMVQPDNIPVQKEANDGQGNESNPAYQVVQPNDIPYQFQVEEDANGGQGNEFHPACQLVQPKNIPASFISTQGIPAPLINLSPETEFNIDEFLMDEADVQGNKFHLANQMIQSHNIPVRGEENDGQDNEFDPASNVQPNNIPASFISTQGMPAPLMLPPLMNLSPEFDIDDFLMDIEEGL